MSVAVIALVVWLMLVFLSVTEGIERSWLEKLTSLNAPIRIIPTEAYYASYYYQIDGLSSASCYNYKSIGEKRSASLCDPYDPEVDFEIPKRWPSPDRAPDGKPKDLVKHAFHILERAKEKYSGFAFQDYEISGAMMRLQLLRTDSPVLTARGNETQTFFTQVSYLASFTDQSPCMKSLLIPPTLKDLNHLFFLSNYAAEESSLDNPNFGRSSESSLFRKKISDLLEHVAIRKIKTSLNPWRFPEHLLPENKEFLASAYMKNGAITHLILSDRGNGKVLRQANTILFNGEPVASITPLFSEKELIFGTHLVPSSLKDAIQLKDLKFSVSGYLQGQPLKGEIFWDGVEIADADTKTVFDSKPLTSPLWTYRLKEKLVLPQPSPAIAERGILLAKSFQDSGILIGDRGYLSYQASTASGTQEQRLAVYVAGFYDPGIMSVGSKCILVHPHVAHTINTASQTQYFDKMMANGIQVWFQDIKEAKKIKQNLEKAFEEAGISRYWKITTFHDFDFAKDLLEQFQSDRYLFTLIGVIILIVACCNIISLLVILVNDKKREIGILTALGASPRSIAFIFGGCGAAMGIISSVIGVLAAILTLRHLDSLIHFLSFLQGHNAFNAAFYGSTLPNRLSHEALFFVLITTPIISLLAGLVPAIKACNLRPSEILRSE